ncbi:hypothetical protein CVT25_009574 [Psilocybe cyanescens]|uniref:Uncharacterized protein n=1 Tax=Psilocybe cyanescens TaxID=93625 RepID=A0A409XV61_PSICY|nr:hypothetical protein CVT25_009574 [Psilocybe cyanescens]
MPGRILGCSVCASLGTAANSAQAVIVTSSPDNPLYELANLPQKAQGEVKDSRVYEKKGSGQSAVFVSRSRFAVLDMISQASLLPCQHAGR